MDGRLALGGWLVVVGGCSIDDKNVGIEDTDVASSSGDASDASVTSPMEESGTSNATTDHGSTSSVDDTTGDPTGNDDTTGGGVCPDPNPEACMLPPEGFEIGLDTQGGCGNVNVWASDLELYTLAVYIDAMQDVIGMAEAAGEPITLELSIGDGADASLFAGSEAHSLQCTDFVPEIFYLQYAAESGTVSIVVDPPDENGETLVDVTLTDVSFFAPKTSPIPLASYVFTDVTVGWLPG